MKQYGKYIVSGLLAGVVNGLFGFGGGVVLVPLLLSWIKLEPKKAFATSVFIILPTSLVSLAASFSGEFDFYAALPYIIGGALGGILSGKFFKKASPIWLKRAFGALLIVGGVRSVFFR